MHRLIDPSRLRRRGWRLPALCAPLAAAIAVFATALVPVTSYAAATTPTQVGVDGTDNAVWTLQDNSTTPPGTSWSYSAWSRLGGFQLAAPAVINFPDPNSAGGTAQGVPLFIVTGRDHSLWQSLGGAWQQLSAVYCVDNPAGVITHEIATPTKLQLIVACQGRDTALWWASEDVTPGSLPAGIAPSSWRSMGGHLKAGPAAAAMASLATTATRTVDKVEFFGLGTDNHIWDTNIQLQEGSPGAWQRSDMACIGHPAAATAANTVPVPKAGGTTTPTFLACQGTDRAAWFEINNNGAWTKPARAGGVLVDGVGIGVANDHADIVVEGNDGRFWNGLYGYAADWFSGWHSGGGHLQFGAGAAALNSANNTE